MSATGIVGESVGPVALRDLNREVRRQKRGLRDPNPGASRLLKPPTTLTTPPTITPGTSGGATAITNSVLISPDNTAFTYLGCHVDFGTVFPNTTYYGPTNIANWDGSTTLYNSSVFAVEFEWYGQSLELKVKGNGATAKYRLQVLMDSGSPANVGYDARAGRGDTSVDGAAWLIKYDFGSAAVRRLRFTFQPNCLFGGIRIGPNDSIWKTSGVIGPRVKWVGDSFTGGAVNVQNMNTFPEMAAWLLGLADVDPTGAGGTGYVATNTGTRTAYGTRVQKDVIAWNPDIVVVSGGINDSATAQATVLAAAQALFAAIRAGLPNATLIVDGMQWPNGSPSAAALQVRDAIRQAAAQYAHLYIEELGGTYPYDGTASHYVNTGWMTGTGKSGTTTGSGNADLFTDTDGTHPTQAGHDFRGARIAAAIAAALPL